VILDLPLRDDNKSKIIEEALRGQEAVGAGCVGAAVGLAIGFGAWSSLVRENGLDSAQAVDLMAAMVAAAGAQ